MEKSPKTTGYKVFSNHPLFFPDGVTRTGDVYVLQCGEWYADMRGVTYAIHRPDSARRVRVCENHAGGPLLKRIE
jgi:hypothetical protein